MKNNSGYSSLERRLRVNDHFNILPADITANSSLILLLVLGTFGVKGLNI